MRRTIAALTFALTLLATGVAHADDLAGTWRREDGKLYKFDKDAQTGELVGKMLNPPAADDAGTRFYAVEIRLKAEGSRVDGKATWIEPNPKKGQAGQPDSWSATARWELALVNPGELKGKTEWLEWAAGNVSDRGFDEHSFKVLPVITLGGSGIGPDKVEAGEAIDGAALAGTWKTASGTYVTVKQAEAGFVLERAAGEGTFPQVKLANEGNVLRGLATWPEGQTGVELKLAKAGLLEGRTERLEGEKDKWEKSWAPWSLERLARVDGGAAAGETPALAPGASADLPLDLKREDGLYLKLTRKDDGTYTGQLLGKKGEAPRATVELAPAGENRYAGKATFVVDGNPVELKWELAAGADGVDARCEWADWDAAAKKAPVKGVVARKFRVLRRVG
jgi:hypothetical protein